MADHEQITRSFLESLSTGELLKMADSYGIEMPQDLERIFIIGELLEAALGAAAEADADADDEASTTAEASVDAEEAPEAALRADEEWEKGRRGKRWKPDLTEPVELPPRYNITFIEVMIRDPRWAFVFWEVRAADRDVYEKSPDFEGYYLRILPCKKHASPVKEEEVFVIPVGPEEGARYLGFPPSRAAGKFRAGEEPCLYAVELGVSLGGVHVILAVSRPFRLLELLEDPARLAPSSKPWVYANPLSRLSGAEDVPILYDEDRASRSLWHCVS